MLLSYSNISLHSYSLLISDNCMLCTYCFSDTRSIISLVKIRQSVNKHFTGYRRSSSHIETALLQHAITSISFFPIHIPTRPASYTLIGYQIALRDKLTNRMLGFLGTKYKDIHCRTGGVACRNQGGKSVSSYVLIF